MFVIFLFPRHLRSTWIIAFFFFPKSVKESQRSSPFFFHIYNLIFPTVEIWKMSQFNVGVFICHEGTDEILLLAKFLCIPLSSGPR